MLTLSITNVRASYSTGAFKLATWCICTIATGQSYRYHVFNGSYIMDFECKIGTHYFNVVELL